MISGPYDRSQQHAQSATSGFWQRLFPVNRDIAMTSMVVIWAGYLLFAVMFLFLTRSAISAMILFDYLMFIGLALVATWVLYRAILTVGAGGVSAGIALLTLPAMALALLISILGFRIVDDTGIFAGNFQFFANLAPASTRWPDFLVATFVHYLVLAGWGGIYLAFSHARATQAEMVRSRQLDQSTRESELRALRYQLNPHFVFNALNSVSSLIIDRKNSQAEQLVEDLADFMRVVLKEGSEHMIGLEQEIDQQVRYLQIEQVRFPDRLTYDVQIDENVRGWKIPALIIQPLIENAIKHGVASSSDPVRISISAQRDGPRLRLTVMNDGQIKRDLTMDRETGTGLTNIRERLSAVYGHEAALTTGNSIDGMAVASVIVPDDSRALQLS
ncbi:histidine kinase [Parasphingorhabdus sp.]|uniref:sensor histidine kinase n=1 Tax=Parasphingorhabdus sp. TaxID=2709688 RepID=UPI003266496F